MRSILAIVLLAATPAMAYQVYLTKHGSKFYRCEAYTTGAVQCVELNREQYTLLRKQGMAER